MIFGSEKGSEQPKTSRVTDKVIQEKHNVIHLIIFTLLIFTLSGLFLIYAWNSHQNTAKSEAIMLAQSLKSVFHPEHVAELSGNEEDIEKTDYIMTKRSLINLVKTTNPIHFAYLMRENDGNIIFLMDSEPTDSADYSPPGQIYEEADDVLRDTFISGKTVITKPTTDRWGTWISVLVPMKDSTNGKTMAVFGIDYSASEWNAQIWERMIPDIIIIICILMLSFALLFGWIQYSKNIFLTKKLSASEAFYRSIFDKAPVGIAIINNLGYIANSTNNLINANQEFERILGRRLADLSNSSWIDMTHPEDLEADLNNFEKFRKGEINGYSMDKRYLRPDGSSIWVNMIISADVNVLTRDDNHICIIRDISESKEMEELVKETNRKQAVLLSNLPGLAYRCNYDHEWTMLFVSDGSADLTGYTPESLINNKDLSYNDLISPEYREKIWEAWKMTLANKSQFRCEYKITTASGTRKWVLELGQGIYNEQGDVEALEGLVLDITGQKMAEEALRKSEERFRIAQEISPDGFTILHPERNDTGEIIDFTFVYENQAIAHINQTDPQKVIGKSLLDLFPTHKGTAIYEIYIHVANTGKSQILEEVNVGEVVSRQTWLRMVVVSMGEDIAIHAQDITERKLAEEALRESQDILQAAFSNSHAGIAIADAPDGKLRYVNNAGLLIRDKSEEEIVKNIDIHSYVAAWKMFHFDGTPLTEDEVPLARAVLYGEACSDEFIIRRDNFEDRYVLANAVPIKDSNNNIKAGMVVFIDITEKKLAEESVRKQNDLFASLLRLLPIGVFMVDAKEGKPLVINEMGKVLLGSGILPDASEHNLSEVYKAYKGDTQKHYPPAEMPITLGMKGISAHIEDMVVERPDGTRLLLEVFGTPVNDKNGEPWASLVTFMDITERKKAEQELYYLAYHDQLTGMLNRRYYEETLKKMDKKRNLPLSIIMCDVNGLKLVNDSFGHDIGDVLLIKAAETISKACRPNDIVFRTGGDEFSILLPKTTTDEAIEIVNKMDKLASSENVANVELSIAWGYETKESEKQALTEIIANAENHMYRHKLYARSSIKGKTIDLILKALFEKSSREAEHSVRVSEICQKIAVSMKMDNDSISRIRMAGLVHDIGKIGIAESILNKSSSLDDYEWSEIKKHPEIGWRILSASNEFFELANYVLNHHERWDGRGYPNGALQESIPLEARIICLADAYDAMTSQRSYRSGMSKEQAFAEIKRCSGTQFDPHVVNAFQLCFDHTFTS